MVKLGIAVAPSVTFGVLPNIPIFSNVIYFMNSLFFLY